ncbi:DUF3667 domain-containing protein [Ahniella affigens]|nr:DUF3667 domain-containing protein [Ahniella affigens]
MNDVAPNPEPASSTSIAAGPEANPATAAVATAPSPAPGPLCLNCRSPLLGEFCYECGQPRKGWIRHISGIVGDFLDSVLNFDSRTLRTLGPLFLRPGHLTTEYFAGRRVRYVTPLRLYFFLSVVAFMLVAWNNDGAPGNSFIQFDNEADGVDSGKPKSIDDVDTAERTALAGLAAAKAFMPAAEYQKAVEEIRAEFALERKKAKAKAAIAAEAEAAKTKAGAEPSAGDQALAEVAGMLPEPGEDEADTGPIVTFSSKPPAPKAADSEPRVGLFGAPANTKAVTPDNPNPHDIMLMDGSPWHPTKNPVHISWLGDMGNAWLNDKVAAGIRNVEVVNREPQKYVKEIFAEAPTVLALMLPFFALLLKVFYVFKRRLYMEHLIVALHSHSFICLSICVIALMIKLGDWTATTAPWIGNLTGLFAGITWLWIPIYLLMSQKRIYGQGWIMTLVKFSLISWCYLFMLIFGLVALVLSSLVNL